VFCNTNISWITTLRRFPRMTHPFGRAAGQRVVDGSG
jgi:hypothetical protein